MNVRIFLLVGIAVVVSGKMVAAADPPSQAEILALFDAQKFAEGVKAMSVRFPEDKKSTHFTVLYMMAEKKGAAKEYDWAIAALNFLQDKRTEGVTKADVHFLRGRCHEMNGDNAKALVDFRKAYKATPTDAKNWPAVAERLAQAQFFPNKRDEFAPLEGAELFASQIYAFGKKRRNYQLMMPMAIYWSYKADSRAWTALDDINRLLSGERKEGYRRDVAAYFASFAKDLEERKIPRP